MAYFNPQAALASTRLDHLILNGNRVSADLTNSITSATINRTITQASTVKLVVADYSRDFLRSPICNQASRVQVGALGFVLVQVAKAQNTVTLTCEDAVINRLRGISGARTQAPGVRTRVQFAAQLCAEAGVPFIGDFNTPAATEPLSRGTTQNPGEDTWTCLTRIAGVVGYRCFSDGINVLFGPDAWLLNPVGPSSGPGLLVDELSDRVDWVNFDYDVGKSVAKATVFTYADFWTSDPGAPSTIRNLGPASGQWLIESIGRNLNRAATTVALVAGQPTLPEPPPAGGGGAHQVSFTAH